MSHFPSPKVPENRILPLANEVCEGYVFTPVCHSVHRGGVSGWGCVSLGGMHGGGVGGRGVCGGGRAWLGGVWGGRPAWHTVNERAVRILLECILVYRKLTVVWEFLVKYFTSINVALRVNLLNGFSVCAFTSYVVGLFINLRHFHTQDSELAKAFRVT